MITALAGLLIFLAEFFALLLFCDISLWFSGQNWLFSAHSFLYRADYPLLILLN